MRLYLLLAALLVGTVSAHAECAEEAHEARERLMHSGPLRFESRVQSRGFSQRECGVLIPRQAQHDQNCPGDTSRKLEEIRIGANVWHQDELGWRKAGTSMGISHGDIIPQWMLRPSFRKVSCLEIVNIDGRDLRKYEFITGANPPSVETLFTDPLTGQVARFDVKSSSDEDDSRMTTYSYDPSIRIEAPVVDAAERRAISLRQYAEAVQGSDPRCRNETLHIIERGREQSFRYEITGMLGTGISSIHGTFSPTRSLHIRSEGIPYHGGDTEVMAIGDNTWIKKGSAPWHKGEKLGNLLENLSRDLMPKADEVGATQCLGRTSEQGHEYDVYTFDTYMDAPAAKLKIATRRMLVDPISQLPVRTEYVGRYSQGTEVRHYEQGLVVKPPT